MPNFIDSIFGKKKPTLAAADAKLATFEADLAAAPGRIAAAEAVLAHVADLDDVAHAAAEAELAAARRSLARLEAQVADLRNARAEAAKAEAEAALRARVAATQKRMDGMPKLLDTYDAAARVTADAADAIGDVDGEVAAINREIEAAKRAGLNAPEPIRTSAELFRCEPDRVEPDRIVSEEVWMLPEHYLVQRPDGDKPEIRQRWEKAGVLVQRDGEMVPMEAGGRKQKVTRTIPGKRRPGRRINSPLAGLSLPASRFTGETHWPRGE